MMNSEVVEGDGFTVYMYELIEWLLILLKVTSYQAPKVVVRQVLTLKIDHDPFQDLGKMSGLLALTSLACVSGVR